MQYLDSANIDIHRCRSWRGLDVRSPASQHQQHYKERESRGNPQSRPGH